MTITLNLIVGSEAHVHLLLGKTLSLPVCLETLSFDERGPWLVVGLARTTEPWLVLCSLKPALDNDALRV